LKVSAWTISISTTVSTSAITNFCFALRYISAKKGGVRKKTNFFLFITYFFLVPPLYLKEKMAQNAATTVDYADMDGVPLLVVDNHGREHNRVERRVYELETAYSDATKRIDRLERQLAELDKTMGVVLQTQRLVNESLAVTNETLEELAKRQVRTGGVFSSDVKCAPDGQ
jgi:uncharacterized coiled-coil protein SlyX